MLGRKGEVSFGSGMNEQGGKWDSKVESVSGAKRWSEEKEEKNGSKREAQKAQARKEDLLVHNKFVVRVMTKNVMIQCWRSTMKTGVAGVTREKDHRVPMPVAGKK